MTHNRVAPRPGLGYFIVPPVGIDPATNYETVVDVAVRADELGYDSIWLAEGHVSTIGLPSSLTFLAALSQRTHRARLGTAVISIALENPITLAEAAAVVNVLSGDRLELGVGKGNKGGRSSASYEAFQVSERERDTLFREAIARFRDVLGGRLGDDALELYPPQAQLRGRLWQATSKPETAREAGVVGDGLQLHRNATGGKPGDVQSALIDEYLNAYDAAAPPRIAVSRVVFPARSDTEAITLLERHLERQPERFPRISAGQDLRDYLASSNIAYGSVDQIVDTLHADAAVVRSTDILFSQALPLDAPEYLEGQERIANEVFPLIERSAAA